MPKFGVLEVVAAHLDGRAGGLQLAPDRLEVPDQLALFGVHTDHRLPAAIASVTVWLMWANCASRSGCEAPSRLFVGLQGVPHRLEQPQHRAIDDAVAHPAQRLGQLGAAL